MNIVPLTLKQANALVDDLHRHHKPARGHRFSIGAVKDGKLVGAAIVGRPVARRTPPYEVAEVIRLVTDGTKNAPSALYAAAARAAQAMGFWKIQTFILEDEPGTSLRAAGWEFDGWTNAEGWNRPSRDGRRTDQPEGRKQRWKKILNRRLEDAEMLVMSA
jgi:L-amino acid N-acyltransferase YncA